MNSKTFCRKWLLKKHQFLAFIKSLLTTQTTAMKSKTSSLVA